MGLEGARWQLRLLCWLCYFFSLQGQNKWHSKLKEQRFVPRLQEWHGSKVCSKSGMAQGKQFMAAEGIKINKQEEHRGGQTSFCPFLIPILGWSCVHSLNPRTFKLSTALWINHTGFSQLWKTSMTTWDFRRIFRHKPWHSLLETRQNSDFGNLRESGPFRRSLFTWRKWKSLLYSLPAHFLSYCARTPAWGSHLNCQNYWGKEELRMSGKIVENRSKFSKGHLYANGDKFSL